MTGTMQFWEIKQEYWGRRQQRCTLPRYQFLQKSSGELFCHVLTSVQPCFVLTQFTHYFSLQVLCDGPSELKWIAGIFFWTSEVEPYTDKVFGIPLAGTGYKKWVNDFIDLGCADDPELPGCDTIFAYASGIVNRGCPDPGEVIKIRI